MKVLSADKDVGYQYQMFLTDGPLEEKYFANETGYHDLWEQEKVRGIFLLANDQKEVCMWTIFGKGQLAGWSFIFEPRSWTDEHIAGKFYKKEDEKIKDASCWFNTDFDAPVIGGSASGTALPVDGGDPAKAFLKFHNSLGVDLSTYKSLVSPNNRKTVEDPEFVRSFQDKKHLRYPDLKFLMGFQNGNRAAIRMSSRGNVTNPPPNIKLLVTVWLVREDNQWKVDKESDVSVEDPRSPATCATSR